MADARETSGEPEGVEATRIWPDEEGGSEVNEYPTRLCAEAAEVVEVVSAVTSETSVSFPSSDSGIWNALLLRMYSFCWSASESGPANESWDAGDGDLAGGLREGNVTDRAGLRWGVGCGEGMGDLNDTAFWPFIPVLGGLSGVSFVLAWFSATAGARDDRVGEWRRSC